MQLSSQVTLVQRRFAYEQTEHRGRGNVTASVGDTCWTRVSRVHDKPFTPQCGQILPALINMLPTCKAAGDNM